MNTFKVGDRVHFLGLDYNKTYLNSGFWKKGATGIVKQTGEKGVYLRLDNAADFTGSPGSHSSRGLECWVESKFVELVKSNNSRLIKQKPMKFALQYELDQDPTEYFSTLPEVKTRLKQLSGDSSLKRDSILIHEIKSTKKVELRNTISIKIK